MNVTIASPGPRLADLAKWFAAGHHLDLTPYQEPTSVRVILAPDANLTPRRAEAIDSIDSRFTAQDRTEREAELLIPVKRVEISLTDDYRDLPKVIRWCDTFTHVEAIHRCPEWIVLNQAVNAQGFRSLLMETTSFFNQMGVLVIKPMLVVDRYARLVDDKIAHGRTYQVNWRARA